MPFVKFDIGSPLPERVSYHMPFDILIDQMKKRGISAKTLSIITDISEEKIEDVYNLPIEQLELFVYDNDNPVAQGVKETMADKYYMRWYNENPQEACRFHGICHTLIAKSFSDDATHRVQHAVGQWFPNRLGISHQTLSMFIGVKPGDIETFLSAPVSLPVDVRYRLIINTIRFSNQIKRFIDKVEPNVTIPDNKNAVAFWPGIPYLN